LNSISHLPDESRWEEKHIDAYYQLAAVLLNLDEIKTAIPSLEHRLQTGDGEDRQRFELGNLYLRVGRIEEAQQLYEALKVKDQSLAAAMKSLMAKQ
jgi:DNA-binding SARP family transcriptional activator